MHCLENLFGKVIGCKACNLSECPRLLRDEYENVPQPGFVGRGYVRSRVMLVGQDPAVPPDRLAADDRHYTEALRRLGDNPNPENYDLLYAVLRGFMPTWRIYGTHFPLKECDLVLDDIAYCNLVRCRTEKSPPSMPVTRQCIETHFETWLDVLQPSVVVFIGKWAFERGRDAVRSRNIDYGFINCDRSLNREERRANRQDIGQLVRRHMPCPT